ncbi:MAG TPA: hypothetical protein VK897_11025 [Anaerolineales bacterium]|nr:hypothetical protein [Anaerolineales bacterium]
MNPRIIVIDGKTYQSVEDMPAEVRQKFQQAMRSLGDANNNNIPDAFETLNIFADKNKNGAPDVLENIVAGQAAVSSMKIVVDGNEFNGIEDLPPEARAKYQEAINQLDANRNGIPDFVEGMMSTTNQTTTISAGYETKFSPRSKPPPANTTITPDTSNGLMLVLTGLFILFLCVAGAAGVWYLFLR